MKNLLKKLLLVEIVALISLSSFFVLPVNAADDPSDRITGMITGLRDLPDSSFKNVIYAAPDDFVRDSGKRQGSKENPYKIYDVVGDPASSPGVTVLLLGGKYNLTRTVELSAARSGTVERYKTMKAAEGANVLFDMQGKTTRGFGLKASYWYIAGIEISNTGQGGNGMRVQGNYNVIEDCVFSNNGESGFQIEGSGDDVNGWAHDNYIINCTSYNSCDTDSGSDADGFAPKLTTGNGNVFDGCISYNNRDDGWDLFARSQPIGVVTIQNCITGRNGETIDFKVSSNSLVSEGNGFKLGGSSQPTHHILINSLSFENYIHGITDNSNTSALTAKSVTSIDNGQAGVKGAGFQLDRSSRVGGRSILDRLLSVRGAKAKSGPAFYDKLTGEISRSVIFANDFYKIEETMAIDNNPVGVVDDGPSADDFVSITPPEWGADLHTLWRNENGTINTHGYMEVKKSSDFYGLGAVFNGKYDIYEVPVELNHKYGDCDSNGKINAKDLTYMKMFLLGRSENPRNNNMDCNKDGRVDVADLTQLKRAIVGGLDLGYV